MNFQSAISGPDSIKILLNKEEAVASIKILISNIRKSSMGFLSITNIIRKKATAKTKKKKKKRSQKE